MYLFSFDYPPRSGGIARLCSEIAREEHRRGTLDAVLTAKPGWKGRPAGLREVCFSQRRALQELQALAFLRRAGSRHVLCGRWWPEAAIVLGAGKVAPIVLVHGAELLRQTGALGSLRGELRRQVLEKAQLVVANSRFTARLVHQIAPGARCMVLPPAVDHERFRPGDGVEARRRLKLAASTRIVATVGRVQRNKGHASVLRALASLTPDERTSLTYVVAGNGPALNELRSLALQLNVSEQVRWLGQVSEQALPDVYRAADLHALLSEQTGGAVEGFGMVSLEAQACGTPVLGSDSGGIADAIVTGRGGFLLPTGDFEAVAAHLRELCANPDRYAKMGALARERVVEECTWAHYASVLHGKLSEMGVTPSS